MGFRAEILRRIWVAVFLIAGTAGRAGTNAAPAALHEAEEFFEKFKQAAEFVERNQTQDAAITLDVLARGLTTSPWMEIAVLKHSQLIESTNDQVAEEGYELLRHRIANAPWFQGRTERAQVFGVALQGAVDAGITRLRIRRVRNALERYRARYLGYPESLAKLAILGYIEMENIYDAKNEPLRYIPTSPEMSPFITYRRYETMPAPPPDPFVATTPRLEGVSQIGDNPPRFSALIKLPGRAEPARLEEDQTIQGHFIAAIARGGVIISTTSRVLVLLSR